MACPTLNLTDETFGPSIEETPMRATPARGEWVGVTLAQQIAESAPGDPQRWSYSTTPQTYNVAGIDLTATPAVSGLTTITVPAAGATLSVPFLSVAPGSTNILAARFRSPAEFLVVAVSVVAPTAATYDLTLYVVPTTGGGPAVQHGPYGPIPRTSQFNLCHSRTGELIMVWWANAYLAPGRAGVVRRTRLPEIQLPDILRFSDPNATGVVGCEVRAATRSLVVFDSASRQGNVAVRRTAASRDLMSGAAPAPGRLRLRDPQLRLPAGTASVGFSAINEGEDFLEITGVSAPGGLVTVAAGTPLPLCLPPGDSLPLVVTRVPGAAAGTAVVTVASVPAPTRPADATATVTLAAAAMSMASPAIRFEPEALVWRPSESAPKDLSVRNVGVVPVQVEVPASPAGPYAWAALPPTTIAPAARLRVATVTLARPTGGVVPDGAVEIRALPAGGTQPIPGSPFRIRLSANPADRVPVGALRIAALVADAPGDDLLPEGEFVDIINVTDADLDLVDCRLLDRTGPTAAATPGPATPGTNLRSVLRFDATTMGPDTRLRPFASTGEVLRVLTRRHSGRMDDPPPGRLRIFLDRATAVWNNVGDTAVIKNSSNEDVAFLSHLARYPDPGRPIPQGTIVQPPPPRRRVMTRRIFVNTAMERNTVFDVFDGDVVRIRDVTGSANFGGFLGSAGTFGPRGNGTPAGDELVPIPFRGNFPWPLPGAPQCCMIARIGLPGAEIVRQASGDTTLTIITSSEGPVPLTLGVNDPWVADNSGYFDCAVDLFR